MLAKSFELYDICVTVRVYSVHDTVPCCQLILNNSLYIQLSVGLGLSSASFSMYIKTNNGKLRHSGCLDLLPCEPMSDSTSGANVQGMYCDLDLVYTPCIEVSSAGRPNRADCQVGLLSYISLVNLGTILQRLWYCECKHIIYPLCTTCLQLNFAAICCDQGSQEWRMYAVDVENTSVINGTLNFTFAGSSLVKPSEKVSKSCGQVWMEGPQSMEGSELQCKISPDDKRYEYMYNCSFNSGMVCRQNATTGCIVPNEGGSKVLVFVFTHI